MINKKCCGQGKCWFSEPVYYYILGVAFVAFMYLTHRRYLKDVYECLLLLPSLLAAGSLVERRRNLKGKKVFILSIVMSVWIVIIMLRRAFDFVDPEEMGLNFVGYLFAFPLASLLRDGDEKKALKIFAVAYLAATAVIAIEGVLLALDCLPESISGSVYWDGGRLRAHWHSNIAACYLMIGVVFCTTFISTAKSAWTKLGLCVLALLMFIAIALTRGRTVIILTGGYLGSLAFFMAIKHGRKWFLPGVAAALVLLVGFYVSASRLYDANYDALLEKYAQQYEEQMAEATAEPEKAVEAQATEETVEPETAAEEQAAEATAEPEKAVEAQATEETVEPETAAGEQAAEATAEPEKAVEAQATEETVEPETAAEEQATEATVEPETAVEAQSAEAMPPVTVDQNAGEMKLDTTSEQGTLQKDLGSFNNRTHIWKAGFVAIRENPAVLIWGAQDPGRFASEYNSFRFSHMHNAWMECLLGFGLIGFLAGVLFTLIAVWNCLIVLLKHQQDVWKRNMAVLTLCILAASCLEPYLFYSREDYQLIEMVFFLCVGYLVCWQEEDNRHILNLVRSKLPKLKK